MFRKQALQTTLRTPRRSLLFLLLLALISALLASSLGMSASLSRALALCRENLCDGNMTTSSLPNGSWARFDTPFGVRRDLRLARRQRLAKGALRASAPAGKSGNRKGGTDVPPFRYSTVTLFARFLGLSMSQPRWRAT